MSHFHYVMAISGAMAIFAGIYYYLPKISGRYCNETMAKAAAWLYFIGMNVTMIPLYKIGLEGMPRRYYDYQQFPQFESAQHVATYGAFIAGLGILVMLVSWIHGILAGEKAPANPWGSRSLEFTHTDVIPGPGNFKEPLALPEGWSPYNYGTA